MDVQLNTEMPKNVVWFFFFFFLKKKCAFPLENMEMLNLTGNRKMKILISGEVSKLHQKCSYHVLLIFFGVFCFYCLKQG